MSDEDEESMSEGFSASEEEWKPSAKDARGGESSDDDDSDFEELRQAPGANSGGGAAATHAGSRKKEPKIRNAPKQTAIKKRKPVGQSLRAKLYNKYRPPPKTFPSPSSVGSNSPSASTSRTAPKNAKTPNESGEPGHDSSSESSVEDYLVNPSELDLQSSFFNVRGEGVKSKSSSPAPIFDCNAGIANLSDSGSEDNNESSADEHTKLKTFDFGKLLDNVNNLERAKETIAKRAAVTKVNKNAMPTTIGSNTTHTDAMDVHSLLALGEKKSDSETHMKHDRVKLKESGEDDDVGECAPQKLNKTKSTRVKRHTKTRPTSTVVAGDTDDSDWEEVADTTTTTSATQNESLEIHVELPTRKRQSKQQKQQQDLEMALRRKLNREMKDRQMLLHKTSLLCCFGRSYFYNRLLNDTALMQAALKLLPSKNSYPPERGTEIKYYESLVTWYKTAIKLNSQNLYADKNAGGKVLSKMRVKRDLLEQIKRKEAHCKQDMVFIFVTLLRGMGMQCRLVVNMQPLPLRPAQTDLLSLKLKRDADVGDKKLDVLAAKKAKVDAADKHGMKEVKTISESPVKKEAKSQKSTAPKESKADSNSKSRKHEVNVATVKLKSKEQPKESGAGLSGKRLDAKDTAKQSKSAPKSEPMKDQQSTAKPDEVSSAGKVKNSQTNKHEPIAIANKIKQIEVVIHNPAVKSTGDKDKKPYVNKHEREKEAIAIATSGNILEKQPLVLERQPATQNTSQRTKTAEPIIVGSTPIACRTRQRNTNRKPTTNKSTADNKPVIQVGSPVIPKIIIKTVPKDSANIEKKQPHERENVPNKGRERVTRSRSKSPKMQICPAFLQTQHYKEKFQPAQAIELHKPKTAQTRATSKSPTQKFQISSEFLLQNNAQHETELALGARVLRSRQKSNEVQGNEKQSRPTVPQLDGADDGVTDAADNVEQSRAKGPQLRKLRKLAPSQAAAADDLGDGNDDVASDDDEYMPESRAKRIQLKKLQKSSSGENAADEAPKLQRKRLQLKKLQKDSDEDFEPSTTKRPKKPAKLPTPDSKPIDRRVLSPDEELNNSASSSSSKATKPHAADIWVEVWSDLEEQWVCIELFKGKLHSVEAIRRATSTSLAYVYAFQNDLSIKDVTARYCSNWTQTMRKSRVERGWLELAISPYYGRRTKRDIREDQELRRIHEEKPMPTSIAEYKDNPLYALERHLLKFQAIYPPDAPTLGFVRGEPVYPRDCVHTLHSREIWLKEARTVKLGEQPYKIVKARPKWDRLTQTVIKDQPLEIFGYWQTQDYEPPTAENGIVPRNAYGNVELFKERMLPKKTVHLRLAGLNRVCKKLGIDCANAVIGFDFHQGSCHPMYDGFVICEEYADTVTAAWHQDQEEQERKELEKYEARVWGNWKKLIRGLLIRERIKKKYNV